MVFILAHVRNHVQIYLMQNAITNMHNTMTEKVLRSSILFFDSNPIGRIITRFSKDMTMLDLNVVTFSIYILAGNMRIISVLITVCIVNPYLLIVFAIGIFLTMSIASFAIFPMIEAQKIEQVWFGPINQTVN